MYNAGNGNAKGKVIKARQGNAALENDMMSQTGLRYAYIHKNMRGRDREMTTTSRNHVCLSIKDAAQLQWGGDREGQRDKIRQVEVGGRVRGEAGRERGR